MLGPFATASRCTPPVLILHCHSPGVATVDTPPALWQCKIDVHNDNDNNDNAWQRGPLWPHRMGPKNIYRGVFDGGKPCISGRTAGRSIDSATRAGVIQWKRTNKRCTVSQSVSQSSYICPWCTARRSPETDESTTPTPPSAVRRRRRHRRRGRSRREIRAARRGAASDRCTCRTADWRLLRRNVWPSLYDPHRTEFYRLACS